MTRDEFLDIMGGIDEELIGNTLEVTRAEVIKPQRRRPSVRRYFMGAAACIAILVTAIAVGFNKGIPMQPDDSSGVSDDPSSASCIIRGWDPERLAYSDTPVLGGNMRVSVAELDGITAELILHNIKKGTGTDLPDNYSGNKQIGSEDASAPYSNPSYYDYKDYVGAEDVVLYVHDDKGRRFIETSVTPHSYNGMELIAADCLFRNCTRLYKVKDEYVLMQYADYIPPEKYTDSIKFPSVFWARFYKLDLKQRPTCDENGVYNGGLKSVRFNNGFDSCNWEYGFPVTREFEHIGSGIFFDTGFQKYNNVLHFKTYEGMDFYTYLPENIMQMLPSPGFQS